MDKKQRVIKDDIDKELFELEQELDIKPHLRWHNSNHKK